MQITWLGQAGLLFELSGKKILIDPYLSNSVAKIEPQNYRRVPVDERFLEIKPDVIIITHNHADHLDKETLCHYLDENSEVTVFAPNGAWQEVRKFGGQKNNYILFNNGTTWTEDFASFRAVKAEHSDEYAIGVILSAEGKNYYITGDTLYSERVFESLPKTAIDVVFLPVNGVGNNMNFADAKRFAERIKAKKTVPVHIGTFDNLNAEDWDCENKVIPSLYKEINL
ncbi:MAG: MBL fold metallo-hydrolase [Clostridiales bacterium]|nr:MBL fold metallo-hydrolase [Clostridiales bacterium]